MKRDIGKEILTGLEDIAAWKRGEKKLRTTEVAMPTAADVKAIRNSLELSQESFAGFLGVSLGTLRNWEQKRREPQGPAPSALAGSCQAASCGTCRIQFHAIDETPSHWSCTPHQVSENQSGCVVCGRSKARQNVGGSSCHRSTSSPLLPAQDLA
jgi:putative transcriptional regulator